MKQKAKCIKDLNTIIKGVTKTLRNSLNSIESKVSKEVLVSQLGEVKASLLKHQDQLTSTDVTQNLTALADDIKRSTRHDFNEIVQTYRKSLQLIDDFESQMAGSREAAHIAGSLKTQFEKIHNLIRGDKVWFDQLIENTFDNLATQGARSNPKVNMAAQDMFLDHIAGGRKLTKFLELNGVEDVQTRLFHAIYKGTDDIPELDRIAAAWKEIDGVNLNRAQRKAPELGDIKQHVLALKRDPVKMQARGFEEFRKFMTEKANREALLGGRADTPEMLDEVLQEIYQESITQLNRTINIGKPNTSFHKRRIKFNSADDEWTFMQQFGKLDQDILIASLQHRKGLLSRSIINQHFGVDVDLSLGALKKHIIDKYGTDDVVDAKKLDNKFNKAKASLETTMGRRSELSVTHQHILRAFSQSVSGSLTGLSAVRNIAYDLTIHSGIVKALTTGEGSILGSVAKTAWALIRDVGLGAAGGTTRYVAEKADEWIGTDIAKRVKTKKLDEMQAVADLFQDQGIAIDVSQSIIAQGILEDAAALANTGSKIAQRADEMSKRWVDFTSKAGMADLTNLASRSYHAVNTGRLMLRHFDNGWKNTNTRLQEIMLSHGIGEAEFNLLSKFDRIQHKGKNVTIDINFKDELVGKLKKDIQKVQKPAETDLDTMNRVSGAYTNYMTDMINDIASIPTSRGQLVHTTDTNLWVALFNTGAIKFSNIALSQWYALYRSMHRATGLNPNIVGSYTLRELAIAKKNPILVAKVIAGMAAGGIAGIWIKDILAGNTPRDIDEEVVFNALSQNGLGGVTSLLANTFVFDDDLVATPASAFIRTGKRVGRAAISGDDQKMGAAAHESMTRFAPGADLWYTRAATKALFRHGLGVEQTRSQRRTLRQRGQDEWID